MCIGKCVVNILSTERLKVLYNIGKKKTTTNRQSERIRVWVCVCIIKCIFNERSRESSIH